MARTLVYVESGKPVEVGDVHTFMGCTVKIAGMDDVASRYKGAIETYSNGSVKLSYPECAGYEHTTFACNIGARWI
jgi:hypothetical protein